MHELEPDCGTLVGSGGMPGGMSRSEGGGAKPDAYAVLKALEKLFEALSVSRRQALLRQADVQGRLAAAVSEAGALADKVAELSAVEENARQCASELVALKEQHADAVRMLRDAQKEQQALQAHNQSLQAQCQEMIRDAEAVNALSKERAASLSDKVLSFLAFSVYQSTNTDTSLSRED